MSVTVWVLSVGLFTFIPRVEEGLQRHERPPITMGTNVAYRSVFEKGLFDCEVLVFDPEATALEGGAADVAGGGTGEDFVADGAEGFAEAAARLMAARPLGPTARA